MGPRDLDESDRDLFKAVLKRMFIFDLLIAFLRQFQSAIADQIREHFPNLPVFDDSKLEPISFWTEVKTDARRVFKVSSLLVTAVPCVMLLA